MKGGIVAGAILAMALAISPFVHSSDTADRPTGVAENAWIPINDRVGFVVVPPTNGPVRVSPQVLMLTPAVSGYFVLKGSAGWTRMVIVEPLRGPGEAG
jgi:hypothetical protein